MRKKLVALIVLLLILFSGCCLVKKDMTNRDVLRGVAKELLVYLDYWGYGKILNKKYECFVLLRNENKSQLLEFYFKNTNCRIVLIKVGGKYYIREPYNIRYDERYMDFDAGNILYSFEVIIDDNAKVEIFDDAIGERAFNEIKKIRKDASGTCLGKVANTKRIADAYIKVYIEAEKTIYYWPVLAELYGLDGGIDFELITDFNNAIPLEAGLDSEHFLVKNILKGLCL